MAAVSVERSSGKMVLAVSRGILEGQPDQKAAIVRNHGRFLILDNKC